MRYRTTVTIRVAPKPEVTTNKKPNKNATTTVAPVNLVIAGPQKFALQKNIRNSALRRSGLRVNAGVGFGSRLDATETVLSLIVTGPTKAQAQTVGRNWAAVFSRQRKLDAARKLRADQRSVSIRVKKQHNELQRVDARLIKLMPIVYHGILRFDAPNGNLPGTTTNGPPPVPEQGSVKALNLAFLRIQLLSSITTLGEKAAGFRFNQVTPTVFATVMTQTPAERVTKTRATTLPALGGLFGGIVFALGAALLVDRADRTIRDPEEAALTFSAPVLSIIPADGEEFAVIAEPNSLAAEAYRGLAAMSIATDRLPKAIMVSTPTGDAHAQVAANFAAALSRLGLKVALVAMSVDQDWYLEAFTLNRQGMVRLPELLERAHTGTLPAGLARPPARHRVRAQPRGRAARQRAGAAPAHRRPAGAPAGALRRRCRRDGDRRSTAARGSGRDNRRVGHAQCVVGDHPRRGHPSGSARRRRPDGAGGSHAFRRGDGRAADHRGLTCRPRCEPAV